MPSIQNIYTPYKEPSVFDQRFPDRATILIGQDMRDRKSLSNPGVSYTFYNRCVKTVQVDSNQEASVAGTFQAFSKDGYMSQQQFAKLCKDSGLLDKKFTQVSAELTFNKVKKIGNRKINLDEFLLALEEIAAKKKMELEEAEKMVAGTSGPVLVATVPPKNKFHDGRNPYNWRGDGDYPPVCKDWVSP